MDLDLSDLTIEVTRGEALPGQPGDLIIAADGDTAGRQAARRLSMRANRLGWRISILTPPPGQDWNDVLLQQRGLK